MNISVYAGGFYLAHKREELMCGDEREKNMGSGRGEMEVKGKIQTSDEVIVHTVDKILGRKQAPSLLLV